MTTATEPENNAVWDLLYAAQNELEAVKYLLDKTTRKMVAAEARAEDSDHEIACLRDALHECMEYFHDEQDAWTEDGQWVSNKQMKLGMMVAEVLAKDYRR